MNERRTRAYDVLLAIAEDRTASSDARIKAATTVLSYSFEDSIDNNDEDAILDDADDAA